MYFNILFLTLPICLSHNVQSKNPVYDTNELNVSQILTRDNYNVKLTATNLDVSNNRHIRSLNKVLNQKIPTTKNNITFTITSISPDGIELFSVNNADKDGDDVKKNDENEDNANDDDDSTENNDNTPNYFENATAVPLEIITPQYYSDVGSHQNLKRFRWHVMVYIYDDKIKLVRRCGGAIANSRSILTVKTCLQDFTNNLTLFSYVNVSYCRPWRTKNCIRHVKLVDPFVKLYNTSNLAMLILTDRIVYADDVDSVRLAKSLPSIYDSILYMPGYGIYENGSYSNDLKFYNLDRLHQNHCIRQYSEELCLTSFVTYGTPNLKHSVCRVESGAPLSYHPLFTRPQLIGLASYVSKIKCGEYKPDVFVSIPEHYGWISNNMLR